MKKLAEDFHSAKQAVYFRRRSTSFWPNFLKNDGPMAEPNMRLLKFLLAFALTAGLVLALRTSLKIGGNSLPVIGNFLNPFTGFWQNAEPKMAVPVFADVSIPGLTGPVKVVYDERGVPHIFAQNLVDAAAVHGFIHAKNRLFQMDLSARRGAGRLSEIFGERTLQADIDSKHQGLLRASERMLEVWKNHPDDFKMVVAYTLGVNTFINSLEEKDYPVEYKLLNVTPEKWTPLKSAICVKNMAANLSTLEFDAQLANTAAVIGEAATRELFPDFNPKNYPIIPDIGQWKGIKVDLSKPEPAMKTANENATPTVGWRDFQEKQESGLGSNNWAISKKRSKSGNPILCNDPHLGLSLPSTWFENQVSVGTANCYGVSLPGVPGIVIGFNEHIAWGQTNTGIDILDWYKIKWANESKTQYLLDGQPRGVEVLTDSIFVKGQEKPHIESVKWTVWGPVASEDAQNIHADMAMRWQAHDAPDGSVIGVFRKLLEGKNFSDYRAALRAFDVPGQNFVFASADGDIALSVTGKNPIKQPGQGRRAQDGSLGENNWRGYIPFENLPFERNPLRAWVGSANQPSAGPGWPYYLWGADFEDFRSRRLFDLMEKLDSATTDDLKKIQLDVFDQKAADALPALLKLLSFNELNAAEKVFADQLAAWDFNCTPSKTEPSLFKIWYEAAEEATWDEIISKMHDPAKPNLDIPEDWRFIEFLERDTLSRWFDIAATPEKETARQIVTRSFKFMAEAAAQKMLTCGLEWYKFKGTEIRHIGRIPGFGVKQIEIGGGKHILNAASNFWGPSWRMVVEMTPDGPVAEAVIPGGVSGNPGSPFYETGIAEWAKGEYFKLHFWKKAEDAGASASVHNFR